MEGELVEDWLLVAFGGLAALLANVMYMWGGTSQVPTPATAGKFWRRLVASFLLSLSVTIIAVIKHKWHWPLLLIYPALIGGFSLPYSADSFWIKVKLRTVFALACVASGLFGWWAMNFPARGCGILLLQAWVGAGSVYLGVVNPYKQATVEQFMICQLLTMTIPFWPFVA